MFLYFQFRQKTFLNVQLEHEIVIGLWKKVIQIQKLVLKKIDLGKNSVKGCFIGCSFHDLHLSRLVLLVPSIMSQKEMKSSSPGTPQRLGESLKLIKGVLMLLPEEQVD